ncbi:uroporphyrin-III C-methyltransferase [Gaertneriomyces sp. JEL0708]|nr:uroporphyrin-III C-methyltransferase [Gaertneriomyces sp. JEL0708]
MQTGLQLMSRLDAYGEIVMDDFEIFDDQEEKLDASTLFDWRRPFHAIVVGRVQGCDCLIKIPVNNFDFSQPADRDTRITIWLKIAGRPNVALDKGKTRGTYVRLADPSSDFETLWRYLYARASLLMQVLAISQARPKMDYNEVMRWWLSGNVKDIYDALECDNSSNPMDRLHKCIYTARELLWDLAFDYFGNDATESMFFSCEIFNDLTDLSEDKEVERDRQVASCYPKMVMHRLVYNAYDMMTNYEDNGFKFKLFGDTSDLQVLPRQRCEPDMPFCSKKLSDERFSISNNYRRSTRKGGKRRKRRTYEAGECVLVGCWEEGLCTYRYGIIEKFRYTHGRAEAYVNWMMAAHQTRLGEIIHKRTLPNPIHETFSKNKILGSVWDSRWKFLMDRGLQYGCGWIDLRKVLCTVKVHEWPEDCPNRHDHVWMQWRYTPPATFVHWKGREGTKTVDLTWTRVVRVQRSAKRKGVIIAVDEARPASEGREKLVGRRFHQMEDIMRRRQQLRFTCTCADSADALYENEYVLTKTRTTLKASMYGILEVHMQYAPNGVPKELRGFHIGVQPTYIAFFRHQFDEQSLVLEHIHDEAHVLAEEFPKLEKKYPIADNSFASLFCGAGLGDYGFQLAGFRKAQLLDHDAHTLRTNIHNTFPPTDNSVILGNMHDEAFHPGITSNEALLNHFKGRQKVGTQVLTITAPCTFSGLNRDINDLWNQYNRMLFAQSLSFVLVQPKPQYIFMENVMGLASPRYAPILNVYLLLLLLSGHQVRVDAFDATQFGLPQHRRRLFLTAAPRNAPMPGTPSAMHRAEVVSSDHDSPFTITPRTDRTGLYAPRSLQSVMGDLVDKTARHDPLHVAETAPPRTRRAMPYVPPGHDHTFVRDCRDAQGNPFDFVGTEQWTRNGKFLRPDFYTPGAATGTVTKHPADEGVHPLKNRLFTLREKMRLQGCPDHLPNETTPFWVHGDLRSQFDQIGNAVPVPISFAYGVEMRKAISQANNGFV